MRFPLKTYQDKAVHNSNNGLLSMTLNVLNNPDKTYVMILKSIMGSGKTVIAADYIEELFQTDKDERGGKDTCILWLSKGNGKLHMQSSDKLQALIETHDVQIFGIESSSDFNEDHFDDKQVYVINWEKLKEKKSNLLEFTENPNVQQALRNTNLDDINFIFVVDEFHMNYEKDTYNRMIDLFHPVFIIGMTATPSDTQMGKADFKHIVPVDDVIAAGMIKKGICFNTINDFDDKSIGQYSSVDEFFLRMSLKQRDVLEQHYRSVGSNVTPLLLIQFDDDVTNEDIIHVKELLDNEYNNNENDDYAIWITDKTKGDERLRSSEGVISNMATNKVKVLLFKQAVATGWDCPRASVLLRYRKVARQKDAKKVSSFDIQTLGRIIRMPEPSAFDHGENKHYSDETLNYGYVYVPSQKYELEDEFKRAYEGTEFAKRPSSRSQAVMSETDYTHASMSEPSGNLSVSPNNVLQSNVEHDDSIKQVDNTIVETVSESESTVPMEPRAKDRPKSFYEENKEYVERVEDALKGQNYRITDIAPDESIIDSEIRNIFRTSNAVKIESDDSGIEKVTFFSRRLDVNDELLEAASDGKKKADIKKDAETKKISVNLDNPIVAYNEAEKFVDRLLKSKSRYSDNTKYLFKTNLINRFIATVKGVGQSKEEKLGQVGRIILKNKPAIVRILDEIDEYYKDNKRYEAEPSDFKFAELVNPSFDTDNKSYEHESLPDNASKPEKVFTELLDSPNNNVQFWYKCPDKGQGAFVVKYDKRFDTGRGNGRTKIEYCCPDFIVALKDGSIGIYETKIKGDYTGKVPEETTAIKDRIAELNSNGSGYVFHGGLIHVDVDNCVIVEPHPELMLF